MILRFADSKTTFYPPGVAVVLDGVIKADWREFAVSLDPRGGERIVRLVYECGVLEALRDRLRCKEIWVVRADKWRNPDEDLPRAWAQDIETTIQMPTHMTRSATQPALPVGACQSPV